MGRTHPMVAPPASPNPSARLLAAPRTRGGSETELPREASPLALSSRAARTALVTSPTPKRAPHTPAPSSYPKRRPTRRVERRQAPGRRLPNQLDASMLSPPFSPPSRRPFPAPPSPRPVVCQPPRSLNSSPAGSPGDPHGSRPKRNPDPAPSRLQLGASAVRGAQKLFPPDPPHGYHPLVGSRGHAATP